MQQSGHTAVSERSMEDNYFLLFETSTVRPCRWIWWVVSGYLRLSPRYLPAIFQLSSPSMPIWSRLSPAISPLSPPSMSMWSRLSPAISGYLHPSMDFFPAISGYLPAIFQISSGVSLFYSYVFICDDPTISLHEMLFAGTESLLFGVCSGHTAHSFIAGTPLTNS